MKKVFSLFLISLICVGLTGCGEKDIDKILKEKGFKLSCSGGDGELGECSYIKGQNIIFSYNSSGEEIFRANGFVLYYTSKKQLKVYTSDDRLEFFSYNFNDNSCGFDECDSNTVGVAKMVRDSYSDALAKLGIGDDELYDILKKDLKKYLKSDNLVDLKDRDTKYTEKGFSFDW